MTEEQYYQISKREELPEKCPLIGKCERYALTILYLTEFNIYGKGKTVEDILINEGLLPEEYKEKKVNQIGEPFSFRKSENTCDIQNACPEVSLFFNGLIYGFIPQKGIVSGFWDNFWKDKKFRVEKTGHFSKCREFSQYIFERKLNTITTNKMPKHFTTEIRKVYTDQYYLKVYLKDLSRINEVQGFLSSLTCTRNVNITASQSSSQNLTVYPSKVYDINEVKEEVTVELEKYFLGNPQDPKFIEEKISSISDKAYSQIIDYINELGRNLEKLQGLRTAFDEEGIRDYFIPFLNSISSKHIATGETFNKIGKTDILVQNERGENIFIGECKIWRGKSQLNDAINQLLTRYVNWRDEKVAIVIFNKTIKNFSDIIEKANDAMKEHPNFFKFVNARNQTSFSYIFKHPEDRNKTINIELMLFDFS